MGRSVPLDEAPASDAPICPQPATPLSPPKSARSAPLLFFISPGRARSVRPALGWAEQPASTRLLICSRCARASSAFILQLYLAAECSSDSYPSRSVLTPPLAEDHQHNPDPLPTLTLLAAS